MTGSTRIESLIPTSNSLGKFTVLNKNTGEYDTVSIDSEGNEVKYSKMGMNLIR